MYVAIHHVSKISGRSCDWVRHHLGEYFKKREKRLASLHHLLFQKIPDLEKSIEIKPVTCFNRAFDCVNYTACLEQLAYEKKKIPV